MHQKVAQEPAAIEPRRTLTVYSPWNADCVLGQSSHPEGGPSRPDRLAEPTRKRPYRRSVAKCGPTPSILSGDLAFSFFRHDAVSNEYQLSDRQNAFDICPMLDRTPLQEIEEFEDELFTCDFGSTRRGVADV